MKKLLPITLLMLVLASCGNRPLTGSLSSSSPDGKSLIKLSAKRQTSIEPFTVTLDVKSGDIPEGSLQFEIAAAQLDSTNVKFKWADAQNCMIDFTQQDGEKRVFRFYASGDNVVLKEETKNGELHDLHNVLPH